jgi:tape measure domain-containing protein
MSDGMNDGLKGGERNARAAGERMGKAASGGLRDELRGGAGAAAQALTSGLHGRAPSMTGIGQMYGGYFTRAMAGAFDPIAVVNKNAAGAEKAAQVIGGVIGRGIGLGVNVAMMGGIGAAITAATVAVGGLGTALYKGFERLKNIDAATHRLRALGLTADEVKSVMTDVTDVVKGTPIALDQAMGAVTVALGSGIKTGEELKRYLTDIADTAGFSGSRFEEMALIFGQVQAKGKLMGEEMMQLMEHKVPIKSWLMDTFKLTSDQLEDMSRKGEISMAMLEQTVEAHAKGMAKKLGDTMEGATENVSAALARVGAAILGPILGVKNDGSDSGMVNVLKGVTGKLDELATWVGGHEAEVKSFFLDVADVAVTMAEAFVGVTSVVTTMTTSIDQGIGGALQLISKFSKGLQHIPDAVLALWGPGPVALKHMGQDIGDFGKDLSDAAKAAENVNDKLSGLADKTLPGLHDKIRDSRDGLQDLVKFGNDIGHGKAEVRGPDTLIRVDPKNPNDEFNINTKFRTEQLDDFTVKIIPLTDEATKELNAWRESQGAQPISAKVDVNIDEALNKAGQLRQMLKDMISAPAAVPAPRLDRNSLILPGYQPPGVSAGPAWTVPSNDRFTPWFDYHPEHHEDGGPLRGPGPKGKDSILMYGAPGEHMWTANEVDAVGGQQEMYRLRGLARSGALRGLADGGPIIIPPGPDKGSRLTPPIPGNWGPDVHWGPNGTPGEDPTWLTEHPWRGWPGPPLKPGDAWRRNRKNVKGFANGGPIPHFDNGGELKWVDQQSKSGQGQPGIPGGPQAAIDYAYGKHGAPYQYGAFDCSEYMSEIYARMAGLPPGRYFNTESDFAALGFKRGFKPGALNIGVNHGGGGPNSHMAGTLPNGVNVENAGHGAVYGPGATGAQSFTDQWYYDGPGGAAGAPGSGVGGAGGGMSGVDPGAIPGGSQPGIAGQDAAPGLGGAGDILRSGGLIPAGAGNSGVAGTSFLSGIYNMGADVINGVIDQAASAASTAISAGVSAGTMGAGAAGGSQAAAAASQFAIGLGTTAAKRGVKYGAQMLGILTDATIEQLTPFGAPRWLGYDYTGFVPNMQNVGAAVTSVEQALASQQQKGGQQGAPNGAPEMAAAKAPPAAPPGNAAAPGTEPMQTSAKSPFDADLGQPVIGNPPPGAGAPPAAPQPALPQMAAPTSGPMAQDQQQQQQPPPPWWAPGFAAGGAIYDSGGVLPPGGVGFNLTKRPEMVLTPPQWAEIQAAAAQPPLEAAVTQGNDYSVRIENVTVSDVNEMQREIDSRQRLQMMRYAGRP